MHHRHPDINPQLLSETEEQRELRTVLRDFFTEESGPEDVRKHLATARGHDETLWARLAGEIGVHGLAIPEEFGGSGYTFAELAVALEESGRALYCAPLLPTVVLAAHALLDSGDKQACERYLPRIANGTLTATVAGFDEAEPGVVAERRGSGWVLRGAADFVLDGAGADLIVVRAQTPEGARLFACEPAEDTCPRTPRRVLDETRRQALVEFRGAPATPVGESGEVTAALDAGRAALAAEQVGGSGHALDATVQFVARREQFGRPHRLLPGGQAPAGRRAGRSRSSTLGIRVRDRLRGPCLAATAGGRERRSGALLRDLPPGHGRVRPAARRDRLHLGASGTPVRAQGTQQRGAVRHRGPPPHPARRTRRPHHATRGLNGTDSP
ncbi:alkylation response protein AidB-like acyl-CoA dehydrogenase [Streptomyces sp. SLBN-8D4]